MPEVENPSRKTILEKIRSALQREAPVPEPPHGTPVFPAVDDILERFRAECAGNLVECVLTSNAAESATALANTLASLPEGDVFVEDAPALRDLTRRMAASNSPQTGAPELAMTAVSGRAVRWSSAGGPPEATQATVTLAEWLVASTGSIVVSSSRGGRGGTVVAPCHVVYTTTAQVVPDLDTAIAGLYADDSASRNSFIGLITGCSRTADIEKILVIGAHGPRRVIVILEESGKRPGA